MFWLPKKTNNFNSGRFYFASVIIFSMLLKGILINLLLRLKKKKIVYFKVSLQSH